MCIRDRSYTDPFRIVQNRTNFIYMAEGFCKVSDTYVEGSYEGKDGRYYYDICLLYTS